MPAKTASHSPSGWWLFRHGSSLWIGRGVTAYDAGRGASAFFNVHWSELDVSPSDALNKAVGSSEPMTDKGLVTVALVWETTKGIVSGDAEFQGLMREAHKIIDRNGKDRHGKK